MDDKRPLLGQQTKVYKRRWWVMIVFNFCSILQTMVWNTWGPVAESSELVFGWDDSTIALLTNIDNITYIMFAIPFTMFMDTKGLRMSMIICAVLLFGGTVIRCITFEREAFTALSYLCGAINGIAGTVPFSGPSLIASIWFPPRQRTTATALASFFNFFGIGAAFILGPYIVANPVYQQYGNISLQDNVSDSNEYLITEKGLVTNLPELTDGIKTLMYVHCGMAVLFLLLCVFLFPDKPPIPPSKTAAIRRTNYKDAFGKMLRNGPLWLIALAFSLPIGVVGNWSAVLDVNVKPLGVTQTDAGWMGFLETLSGCVASLLVARFSDIFMKKKKTFLITLFICASGSCIWFSLICNSFVPFNLPSLYISCILLGTFSCGSIPLFYEIAVETSYPVAEGITGGFLTLMHCVVGIIFLSMFSIPRIGTVWMNWCLLGSFLVTLPILVAFPARYKRTDIDLNLK